MMATPDAATENGTATADVPMIGDGDGETTTTSGQSSGTAHAGKRRRTTPDPIFGELSTALQQVNDKTIVGDELLTRTKVGFIQKYEVAAKLYPQPKVRSAPPNLTSEQAMRLVELLWTLVHVQKALRTRSRRCSPTRAGVFLLHWSFEQLLEDRILKANQMLKAPRTAWGPTPATAPTTAHRETLHSDMADFPFDPTPTAPPVPPEHQHTAAGNSSGHLTPATVVPQGTPHERAVEEWKTHWNKRNKSTSTPPKETDVSTESPGQKEVDAHGENRSFWATLPWANNSWMIDGTGQALRRKEYNAIAVERLSDLEWRYEGDGVFSFRTPTRDLPAPG